MKILLRIVHDLAFIGVLFFIISHVVRVIFLTNLPIASPEAIATDIRLDRAKLFFAFILSLIPICIYIYRRIKKIEPMRPTIYSLIIAILLSFGSVYNHYNYNKEVVFIDNVYKSKDIYKIRQVAEIYKNNYSKQNFHEFYKLSIIENLEKKIKDK